MLTRTSDVGAKTHHDHLLSLCQFVLGFSHIPTCLDEDEAVVVATPPVYLFVCF